MKRYSLEFYLPDNSGLDAVYTIESDEPFAPIQTGDIINPRCWPTHYFQSLEASRPSEYGIVLKVTGFEHFIIPGDDGFTQHKVGVFSTALPDDEHARNFN